jgi:hypothetical protein
MKQKQLQELVKYIAKQVVKEYLSSMDTEQNSCINPSDPSLTNPIDTMSSLEKERMRKQQDLAKQQELKRKEQELKTAKKEMEFQKQKVDQAKRFTVPNLTKQIQQAKREI